MRKFEPSATVASGPNAILFGLGSPAGIIDATPARAQMKNRYGFTLQDRLALRLMGMSKREHADKKPNLDRDDRIYGALTFRPFKYTSIILQGERDHRGWVIRSRWMSQRGRATTLDQRQGAGSSLIDPIVD